MVTQYPTSVEAFMQSKWEGKVKSMIGTFNLLDDKEDLFQDIVTAMLEKNYLERWDESKGAYSTWLYMFVRNFLRKRFNHDFCQTGKKLAGAIRLDKNIDETPLSQLFAVEERDNLFIKELLAKFATEKFAANSTNQKDGVEYNRDVLTVCKLMLAGDSVKEVATKFGTSVQFIYTLLKRARKEIYECEGK